MRLERLRAEIANALRRLAAGGLVLGAAGNVSAREDELVAISPTKLPYETLRPEDVAVVSATGELLEGPEPSVELPSHLLLLARPDVGAVVHTHSPYATGLGCVLDEIPVTSPGQAAAVGGAIPVAPYARSGEAATGEAVLEAAAGRWAAIVRNHGPFCLGRDLADALACAFAVEEAARAYALARAHGEPSVLPVEEVERLARRRPALRIDQSPHMPVPHLFRVILPVPDIEAAASFYARVLGLPGDRVSAGRHYFDCGGTILACYDALADGDPEQVGPNSQYVYFSADDLDAAYERARSAGCSELGEIEVQPWGERSFYARDPFANPICFVDSQTLFTG